MQLYTGNPLCFIAEAEEPDQVKPTHIVYRRNIAGEGEGRILASCAFNVNGIFLKSAPVDQRYRAFLIDVGLPVQFVHFVVGRKEFL